jgi:hypothetical protein
VAEFVPVDDVRGVEVVVARVVVARVVVPVAVPVSSGSSSVVVGSSPVVSVAVSVEVSVSSAPEGKRRQYVFMRRYVGVGGGVGRR